MWSYRLVSLVKKKKESSATWLLFLCFVAIANQSGLVQCNNLICHHRHQYYIWIQYNDISLFCDILIWIVMSSLADDG